MELSFGIKNDRFLHSHQSVELWQVGPERVKEVIQAAYVVYEESIARKNNYPLHPSVVTDAIALYSRWHRNSILLAYQSKEGEIIAATCLTQKTPSISLYVDKLYQDYLVRTQTEVDYRSVYFGSLTFVAKKVLERLNIHKSVSFTMYRQLNLLLGNIVAQDEKPAYLGELEQTALLLINRALGMGWEPIGIPTPWLGSLSYPACLPIDHLKSWINRNQRHLSLAPAL
jgi:hypothetical protein